ncbi:hypothetical protein HA466_0136240 [Hirschfeldia incana]|nr:hypothetical protein HA466_0136240 [Hirschfeldia incana]KAJ0251277.1 hypothetical protein HA466_0136240 [Hirschfeldia incana]KAJ0251278.1 hypothetical protein HA466_0136240 [Hirschfeldia incana]KAJ0251279.1 hypothetical protein HA466_0136240 [Hirschfeldia incana]
MRSIVLISSHRLYESGTATDYSRWMKDITWRWWSELGYLTWACTSCQFFHDTEGLQFINNIRKRPLGAHIKHTRQSFTPEKITFTPEQINGICYVIILSNKAVFDGSRNSICWEEAILQGVK